MEFHWKHVGHNILIFDVHTLVEAYVHIYSKYEVPMSNPMTRGSCEQTPPEKV